MRLPLHHAALACLALLSACAAPGRGVSVSAAPPSMSNAPMQTRILDHVAATRLRQNTGMTLQWIDWDTRGSVQVTVDDGGMWRLSGEQARGSARVAIAGRITEIGPDYFLLDGRITIADTPDAGRRCAADKTWRFAVTQDRRYWRLREFEWCDRLTDYIDIYF